MNQRFNQTTKEQQQQQQQQHIVNCSHLSLIIFTSSQKVCENKRKIYKNLYDFGNVARIGE